MIVLDASAATDLLLYPTRGSAISRALGGQELVVPAHFDAEVYGALRDALRRRALSAERAEHALLECARLRAERVALPTMLAQAFALRDRFGRGDVFYVVLARARSGTLLTSDARLARAAEGYVQVHLVTLTPPA